MNNAATIQVKKIKRDKKLIAIKQTEAALKLALKVLS